MADWGLSGQNVRQLHDAVERMIYTPGSSSGIPVNILASFEAPEVNWDENEELLREKISATVTALLTLIGLKDIDPLRSREHILLSNIVETNWRKGASLDLQDLILQTQDPPLEKLGAFALNDFFPKRDRSELAMQLNNFLLRLPSNRGSKASRWTSKAFSTRQTAKRATASFSWRT